jgi:hypothetical protein
MQPADEQSDRRFEVQLVLSGADLERLIVVGSDLEFLRDLPRDRLPSHTEVRLAAGVLRRLLLDGLLDAAWQPIGKEAGAQLTVEATEIDTALSKWPPRWIFYGWAGGASSNVAHHAGMILASIPKEDHEKYGSPDALICCTSTPNFWRAVSHDREGVAGLDICGYKDERDRRC